MFYIELKRSIHNRTIIYLMIVTVVAFVMGWALPAGLEKIHDISYEYYFFSTYTVFTQFGFLLFGFVTAYFFNKDYRDKNILFYQSFNINILKFYCMKVGILLLEEFISIAVCLFVTSMLFHSFSLYLKCLILFSLVVFQYFIVVGIFSLVLKNMLVSLGVSIVYWIATIIMSTFGGVWKCLAAFDASNGLYIYIEKYLSGKANYVPSGYFTDVLFEFIILILAALIVNFIIRKNWVKKGM